MNRLAAAIGCGVLLVAAVAASGAAEEVPSADWTTWGYDKSRSGWNRGETILSARNVSKLKLKWTARLPTPINDIVLTPLTTPLVVQGAKSPQGVHDIVVSLGSDDTLYVLDAMSGEILWQKTFPNALKPRDQAVWECPNVANATPVVDKPRNLVFFTTSDGKLRGLDLGTGEERLTPTDFIVPFSRTWSLNLIDGIVYTGGGRGCGGVEGGKVPSGNVSAMDVNNLASPKVSHFYTGIGRPGGPWGRGGVVLGPKGIYAQTADGMTDPAAGLFGEAVVAISRNLTQLVDSFSPDNWQFLNTHDLDMGSAGPIVFPLGDREFVAAASKEGVLYILNAHNLGGGYSSITLHSWHARSLETTKTSHFRLACGAPWPHTRPLIMTG